MTKNLSGNFWLLSISMFLFMSSFNLMLPELNDFVTQLNGGNLKGFVMIAFTIAAGLSRPIAGKLADSIGRKPVIQLGFIICIVATIAYPFASHLFLFFLLRFVHGFSVGFAPTGATALVTDLLPRDKRGIGMGIWGTFISLGIGFGQPLGAWITTHFGLNAMFLASSLIACLAYLLTFLVQESLQKKESFQLNMLQVPRDEWVEPTVFPAAIVMFLTAFCSGIIFILTPDLSEYLNLKNKGTFFGIYVISTILVRLFTGKLSDKIGRRETLLIGVIILTISMLLIGISSTTLGYTIASFVFGIATGIMSPTLFAWTADLSAPERRGIGSGTMFIALEFGIAAGAGITLLLYDNTYKTIYPCFLIGAISSGIALIYLIYSLKFKENKVYG